MKEKERRRRMNGWKRRNEEESRGEGGGMKWGKQVREFKAGKKNRGGKLIKCVKLGKEKKSIWEEEEDEESRFYRGKRKEAVLLSRIRRRKREGSRCYIVKEKK